MTADVASIPEVARVVSVAAHGTHWGAAPTFIEDDVQANEISLKHFGNLVADRLAQLQTQRGEWREFLLALYASEAEQDETMRTLKKQVLMGEAEALANPGFHRWMREREQDGVGAERLSSWYHEDAVLALTPYLAAVPFPRQLTGTGWGEVMSTIDELLGAAEIDSARLEWCVLRRGLPKTPSSEDAAAAAVPITASGGNVEIRSGACVRAAYDANAPLQAALADTPCIFLCDGEDPSHDVGVSTLRLFVARGSCVACEPLDAAVAGGRGLCIPDVSALRPTISTTGATAGPPPLTASTCGLLAQLQEWVRTQLGAALPNRSYAAAVRCHCRRDSTTGDVVPSFYLLNLEPLDAVDTAAFAWSDLVGLILPAEMRRSQRAAALAAAAAAVSAAEGGEAASPPAMPPVVPPLGGEAPPLQFRGAWHMVEASAVGARRPPGPVLPPASAQLAASTQVASAAVVTTPTAIAGSPNTATSPLGSSGTGTQQTAVLAAAAAVACAVSVVVGVMIGRRSH
jgi:hypothetical protein